MSSEANFKINMAPPLDIIKSYGQALPSLEKILSTHSEIPHQEPLLSNKWAWSAEFYKLSLSSAYNALNREAQEKVLKACTLQSLEEALSIEISGMSYAAKMALLSENISQRELYSRFAADEATHYRMIRNLVGVPTLEKAYKNSFLVFLEDLIRNESRISLILLIQVILEGWGIVYYSKLANYALQPEVRDTLKQIVADESSHHGSGITLFKDAQLKEEDELRIAPKIIELLSMLRCGPLGVLSSLYHEMGGMNKTQIKTYLQETGADQKINEDLLLMKQLLTKASAQHIVKAVEEKGLWETPTLDECAQNLAIVLGARA